MSAQTAEILVGSVAVNLIELGKVASEKALNLSKGLDAINEGSKELFEMFKPVFPMTTDYATGKANTVLFVQRIYDTFPEEHRTVNPNNPGKFYSWTTAAIKHGNKRASGLKALQQYIDRNIQDLYFTEETIMKDGEPVKDETTGEVVKAKKPSFAPIATEHEKNLAKVFAALKVLEESALLSPELKEEIKPALTAIADALRPDFDAEKAEKEKKQKELKAKEMPAPATEEKPEAIAV